MFQINRQREKTQRTRLHIRKDKHVCIYIYMCVFTLYTYNVQLHTQIHSQMRIQMQMSVVYTIIHTYVFTCKDIGIDGDPMAWS